MKDERKRQEFRNLLNGMHQEHMLKKHKESTAHEKKKEMAKKIVKKKLHVEDLSKDNAMYSHTAKHGRKFY